MIFTALQGNSRINHNKEMTIMNPADKDDV
jgi:hypothetical protein